MLAYPWLSPSREGDEAGDSGEQGEGERYLLYQPFGGLCNQFHSFECALALARTLGRTLVLPRWRPQYGQPWMGSHSDYFCAEGLRRASSLLVGIITIDEFAARRAHLAPGSGVQRVSLHLEYNKNWSDDRGFELFPGLRSLLWDWEYFGFLDELGCNLGCSQGHADIACRAESGAGTRFSTESALGSHDGHEMRLRLPRPWYGRREVCSVLGSVSAPVLALDHAFNIVVLGSLLDAGERALVLSALQLCGRLRARLNDFFSGSPLVDRPCLAAHVRRTDMWHLMQLMGDKRCWPSIEAIAAQIHANIVGRRLTRRWLLATDTTDEDERRVLSNVADGPIADATLLDGEDAVAVALLHLHSCVHADFFIGTRGSTYSEYIVRFRIEAGKLVDHMFFAQDHYETHSPEGVSMGVRGAPQHGAEVPRGEGKGSAELVEQPMESTTHDHTVSLDAVLKRRVEAVQPPAVGGTSLPCAAVPIASEKHFAQRRDVLGLMASHLPPELLRKVLSFHPDAAALPKTLGYSPIQLFEAFSANSLPLLRALPFSVAPAKSTDRLALLIEPRCHVHLEHTLRNAAFFLSGEWQMMVVHGTSNFDFIQSCFEPAELSNVQFVDLGVENLSPAVHNELMCTHWLWSRVAAVAEHVLVFQTDSLLCRSGIDQEFVGKSDYIGAPWRLDDLWCVGKPWLQHAGNGGFSLRHAPTILRALDSASYSRGQCEDVFFVEHLPAVGGRLAPRELAHRFAVESASDWPEDSLTSLRPLGFHAAYKWLNAEQMGELLSTIMYENAGDATAWS